MANDILITPGRSSIQFSGSITNNVELIANPTGSVTFYGNRAGSTSKPILTVYDTGSGYVGVGLAAVPSASIHTFSPSGGFAIYVQTPTQDAFVISAVGSANVMIGKTADDGINRLQIVGSVSASAFTGSFQGGATGSFTGSIQATGSVSGTFTGNVTSANANLSGSLSGSFRGLSSGSFSGSLSATGSLTGSFTGQLTSANANLSGSLTGSLTGIINASGSVSGTFTGAVTSATLIATGSVSGAFTGAVTSATARMTGSFSGSFAGQALATGSFSGSFKGDGSNLTGVVTTLAVTGALSSSGLMTSGTIDLKTQSLTLSGSLSKGVYVTFDNVTRIATFDLAQSISQSANVIFNSVTASFTGSLTGSMFGTSSYALTASYALNAGLGYNTTQFTQNTPTASWIIPHTLRTQSPMVQVYDLSYNQIIPNAVIGVDNGTLKIEFLTPTTGYAMISNGGGLSPTGSQALLSQSSAAVTWSFAHNLNTKYPVFQVYGNNDEILIPAGIKALSPSGSEIYFATPTTGVAVAEFSGTSGSFIGTVGDGLISGSLVITGNLTVSGSITELSTRSAKSDIAPLSYSTADFMKLMPVSYTLNHTGTKEIGFIAEDVHNIYPEISKDGLSVSYTKFAPVLFQVIQEQQKRIERLEQMLKNNNNIS